MRTHRSLGLLVLLVGSLTACGGAGQGEDEELVGSAEGALVNENALNVNALNVNALNVNALNVNALNVNALSADALAALTDPGSNGALVRQLLEYTVGCALDTSQSFGFSWTDTLGFDHPETYWGQL